MNTQSGAPATLCCVTGAPPRRETASEPRDQTATSCSSTTTSLIISWIRSAGSAVACAQ